MMMMMMMMVMMMHITDCIERPALASGYNRVVEYPHKGVVLSGIEVLYNCLVLGGLL